MISSLTDPTLGWQKNLVSGVINTYASFLKHLPCGSSFLCIASNDMMSMVKRWFNTLCCRPCAAAENLIKQFPAGFRKAVRDTRHGEVSAK